MLTTITSPEKAKVKNIFVAVGDSVKQGQPLVEFE
jgi:biotin carboxyl carrier protein